MHIHTLCMLLIQSHTVGVSGMVVMCLCIVPQNGTAQCTDEVCNGTSSEEGDDGGILDPGAPPTQAPVTTQPPFSGQYAYH